MRLCYKNLTIRNAEEEDAELLAAWWNDGAVMAHAGFPNGTGQTAAEIARSIKGDSDGVGRRLIIELDGEAIGEMNYRRRGEGVFEIGVKICDASKQNRGIGRLVLSMLITSLFDDMGCSRVTLDTNVRNERARHVYERLGFQKLRVNENSWTDQLGEPQSSIDYELTREHFNSFIV